MPDYDILSIVGKRCKQKQASATCRRRTGAKGIRDSMGLKIMMGPGGKPCRTWYGIICRNGGQRYINLGVPLVGEFPKNANGRPTLSAQGDEAFERSRRAAQRAFDRLLRTNRKKTDADLAAEVLEARTGQKAEGVALDDMGETWISAQPKKSNATWRNAERKWFADFAKCARREAKRLGRPCDGVKDITPEIVAAWIARIKSVYSFETVKRQVQLMGAAFDLCVGNRRGRGKNCGDAFEVVENPFIVKGRQALDVPDEGRGVSRVPLTEGQLVRLFDLTRREAPAVYPLVVCAACTGLRIGDVCALKWEDVDLDDGLITLRTAKTKKRVTLPIFARLREVLDDARPVEADGSKPSPYVFPEARARYARNPDGVYRSAKPYFARAVFGDGAAEAAETVADGNAPGGADTAADGDSAAQLSAVRDIDEALAEARFTDEKKERVREVYRRFKSGIRSCDIASALDLKRSQVSMYLADAEALTGERLRPLANGGNRKPTKAELAQRTRRGRETGRHAASLYGWHSLRATFVVLAGEAGVPLSDVQMIVGHTTLNTTSRHYYNPTQRHTAERVKRQMQLRGTILDTRTDGNGGAANGAAVVGAEAPALPLPSPSSRSSRSSSPTSRADALAALVAGMTDAERRAFAARLLGADTADIADGAADGAGDRDAALAVAGGAGA